MWAAVSLLTWFLTGEQLHQVGAGLSPSRDSCVIRMRIEVGHADYRVDERFPGPDGKALPFDRIVGIRVAAVRNE